MVERRSAAGHGGGILADFENFKTCRKKALTDSKSHGLVALFPDQFPCFLMPIEIKIRKNEPVDRAIRRMKKKLERENIIKDVRAKRYYEKPCEKRRRKAKVAAFTAMLRARYAQ
jgi:small subunit ribosomal protein S21